MISGIQILGIIFGLLMTYFTFLHYKRKDLQKAQFLFWEILWLCFITIVIAPTLTGGLVKKLNVTSIMDFLTITGLMFITFLTFYNYINLNKIKIKLEEKIRKEALQELDNIEKHKR